MIPYYIGIRSEDNKTLYKLTDYSNYDEMVLKVIDDIMIPENHNRFFYALCNEKKKNVGHRDLLKVINFWTNNKIFS